MRAKSSKIRVGWGVTLATLRTSSKWQRACILCGPMQLHHCVIAWPRLGQTTVIKNVNQSPEVLDFILVENDHFWGGFQCKRPPNRRVVKKQSHAKLWDVDLKWNAWKWMELQGFKGNKNEWSEHNPYRFNSTQTLEFPLFSMDFTPIGFPEFCMGLFF